MASAEQTNEMLRLTVAAAVAEALKQLNFASAVVGGEDGGRSGGEGTIMREVVDTIVKRTEKFGGAGFQDWKFRIEMAVKGSCGRLHDFMEWAEDTLIRSRASLRRTAGTTPTCTTSLLRGRRERSFRRRQKCGGPERRPTRVSMDKALSTIF